MTQTRQTIANCGLPPTVKVAKLPSDEIQCDECSELFERSEINSETNCCEPCTGDNYTYCESCGDITHDNDIRCGEGSNGDTYYCETCYDNDHVTCTSCGASMASDDSRTSDSGDDYCEECYYDNYFYCEGCESETPSDECHSTDDGCYCSECAPSQAGADFEPKHNWTGTDDYNKIGSSRKFGIELESYDSSDYHEWIEDTDWGAKEDGSTEGKEFVSPPMWGNDGYDSVMDFCDKANRDGVSANRDCGYHLHLDLSDTCAEDRKGIALAYHYTREVWADFIHHSRRDTSYAFYSSNSDHRSNNSWDEKSIMDSDGHPTGTPRYTWLNWGAYYKFGTVEVRSHEPTFDGQTVINWIKAHTIFIDYVKGMTVGEITRKFGKATHTELIDTMRSILPTDVADHYIGKMHLSDMGAA